ncbi:MAG: rubredoxin [Selenomonadaceae bacterium]|nr:rubredoxin [Selenomonadaceae bacterium]
MNQKKLGKFDAEPDDFACPVCGMPKKAFKLKQ